MRISGVKLMYISYFTVSLLLLFSRGRDHLLTSADTSVGIQYGTAPFESTGHSQWKEQLEELQSLYVSEG
jgi:hypothetical protein